MSYLESIAPVMPVAAWIGGKRNLAKRVVARINAIDHDSYAEAFVGMGGIFLRRDQRPKCEVINDWSEDVTTFFRILQHHYVAFLDMIRFQISSRSGLRKAGGDRSGHPHGSATVGAVPVSAAPCLRRSGREPTLRHSSGAGRAL